MAMEREQVAGLYEQHAAALVAYARSFFADENAAQDVVQQAFLALLERGPASLTRPGAYLAVAVRSRALDELRRRKREDAAPVEATPVFESEPGRELEARELEERLELLPRPQREVLMLRVWNELSIPEISRIVGAPRNTVASRLRYARARLRELFPERSAR